jgi:4-diphosphocytidyl-2-C-methyl-D-erythritol kinase
VAKSLLIRSFGKINLFLDIICKRSDGYHNIESVFQSVDLHDELSIELLPSGLEVSCDNPDIPSDSRNLAAKAFLAIREVLNYRGGVRISIKKRIPAGAGLGGGSSNAAVVLEAFNHLLQSGLSEKELCQIAQRLGADVPFFLHGGLAAVWGIGERVMPLPPPSKDFLVIAVPSGVSVPTALAYSKVNTPECLAPPPESFSQCGPRFRSFVASMEPLLPLSMNMPLIQNLYNGLETPVFKLFPQVAQLKQAMLSSGAKAALMSGSGSAVFGIAESPDDAVLIQRRLNSSLRCRSFVAATNNSGQES